jgi:hypothetical protein
MRAQNKQKARRLRIFAESLESGVCKCYDDKSCSGWSCTCDLRDLNEVCSCVPASCLALAIRSESREIFGQNIDALEQPRGQDGFVLVLSNGQSTYKTRL